MTRLVMLLCMFFIVSCTTDPKFSNDKRKLSERYVEMGVRYMQMGKLNIALERLEQAVDTDDDNVNAQNSLAVFYEGISNYGRAKDHFDEALSLDPESPMVLNNYGRFLCGRGDIDQGLVHLLKSANMALNERPWFAMTNVGICEFKRGNSQQAEAYYRRALIVNPSYEPALLNMAEISYDKSEFMKTRAFLERFLNYRDATPNALVLGFLAEQALGQDEKSEEYKTLLLSRFPLSDEAAKVRQMQDLMPVQKDIPSRLIKPGSNQGKVSNVNATEIVNKLEPSALSEAKVSPEIDLMETESEQAITVEPAVQATE